ncbi:aromatic ring-hydroxylating oxygenase subunit alpha [Dawidia soli]|uniref:Aromatic ring-hydroxylating dioxygenase subunit alpha n=1 Tax=Dawidia soli TaxID=2782352 RepID=A0AAP2GF52_9BACT|nr:aromatic ring-hydroxylating dioxygenase subunit alpha [Dawidia soli]MBT1689044.1 aromatic ring-hydroxylating dioxygenase subunit alpha [Dawidia soli]
MTESLFLRNLWYFAMHGEFLKPGKLVAKEILGERIVFGRNEQGEPFALKDNCPHRGVPLSMGWYDGKEIQCCYHGWKFNHAGTCTAIPALADDKFDRSKIKVFNYPCRELNGTIWIYIPRNKTQLDGADSRLPDLLLKPGLKFRFVEKVTMPADVDHAVIGLIDPAHVTFVHQSWYWRSAKKLKRKEKHFEPDGLGFKMVRHKPSSNSKGYSILKGETSTEINFQLPGNRFEHIRVGDHEIISITCLTPINEKETELNHIFYASFGFVKYLWWPLRYLGKQFIHQDLGVFRKLQKGLETKPTLMLLGEPDAQARWYHELKRQWDLSQQEGKPFENPVPKKTLHWVT